MHLSIATNLCHDARPNEAADLDMVVAYGQPTSSDKARGGVLICRESRRAQPLVVR
jgi:hypothetical protein